MPSYGIRASNFTKNNTPHILLYVITNTFACKKGEKMAGKILYNKGKGISRAAFIFACPGQKEEKAGRVVAGATGKNLDLLLSVLSRAENEKIRALFPSDDRYDYLITNSSDTIHYPALDGTSLPSRKEYSDDANLNRLFHELDSSEYIIAFGVQAKEAAKLISLKYDMREIVPRPKFITSLPHLSLLALNRISHDIHGNEIKRADPEATLRRIETVAKTLEEEISKA